MADNVQQPQAARRLGSQAKPAGLRVVERVDVRLASVAARTGKAGALKEAFASSFGVELPDRGLRSQAGGVAALWSGPGRWLVLASGAATQPAGAAALASLLHGTASVTDQSDGRIVLEMSGMRVRDVLAKGVMLDLHDRRFAARATAMTSIAHIDVQISRLDDAGRFEILVPRSFARSFWNWLENSAAEFGMEVNRDASITE